MAIATTFQITDATTTVDLQGTNATTGRGAIIKYTPKGTREKEGFFKEKATIRFRDTSLSGVLATIDALHKLFAQASRYSADHIAPAIYIKYRADSTLTLRRALLLDAKMEYDSEALGFQIRNNVFKIDLDLTRVDWEADTEVQVNIYNGGAAKPAAHDHYDAITLYNHDDATAGHDNFFDIDAADVGGVIDAGCRLELTNKTPGATIGKIFVGINAHKGSAMPTHQIECESMTGFTETDAATVTNTGISFDSASKEIRGTGLMGIFRATGGQTIVVSGSTDNNGTFQTVSATADKIVVAEAITTESAGDTVAITDQVSNGHYGTKTVAGSSTTECGRVILSATELAKFAGNFFHALMRSAAANTGIYVCLKVCYHDTTTALCETPEVLLSTDTLADLGVLQIPPYLRGTQDLTEVDLVLFGRKSGGFTISGDFIQLFGCDSFRIYTPAAGGLGYDLTFKDDSMVEFAPYVTDASSDQSGHYNAAPDKPLTLTPGQDHRVYVLAARTDNTAPITQTFTAQLFYRPRYLTL